MALLPFSGATGVNRVKRSGDTMTGNLAINTGTTATAALDVKATSGIILNLQDGGSSTRYQFKRDTGGGAEIDFNSGIATMVSQGSWQLKTGTSQIKMQDSSTAVEIHIDVPNKGIFTSGGDDLGLGTNSTNTQVYMKNGGNVGIGNSNPSSLFSVGSSSQFQVNSNGLVAKYNNISTVGNGIPSIYGQGRSTGQTAAVTSVATYTVGGSDGSFIVSANTNITTFVAGTFNVTVAYTDETNTAQTLKLNFSSLTGTLGIAIAAAGPFEGIPAHIRCKASTTITIATSGTFTSLTYNVEGVIQQIA